MDCYSCKFRGSVPGDTHSECNHEATKKWKSSGDILLKILTGDISFIAMAKESGIKLNPNGVKLGWASWPLNFDPIWVDECPLFESLDEHIDEDPAHLSTQRPDNTA